MMIRQLRTDILVYPAAADLPADEAELLAAARSVLEQAYAPYSQFQVAAAVRLDNGEIVTATNTENAAYPMCLCAERGALAAAASRYPGAAPVAMAITVSNRQHPVDTPAGPCGACRQVMVEQEVRFGRPMQVLFQGETGPVYLVRSAQDLLPLAFTGTFLK